VPDDHGRPQMLHANIEAIPTIIYRSRARSIASRHSARRCSTSSPDIDGS
jgi:hypothetical protein